MTPVQFPTPAPAAQALEKLAEALAGYADDTRVLIYLATHAYRLLRGDLHRVYAAPQPDITGEPLILVLHRENWYAWQQSMGVALNLVAAIEDRPKIAVLYDWLPPHLAAALLALIEVLPLQREATDG